MTFVGGKQHTKLYETNKVSLPRNIFLTLTTFVSEFLLHTNIPPERQSYALAGSTCMLQPTAKIRFKSYTYLNPISNTYNNVGIRDRIKIINY